MNSKVKGFLQILLVVVLIAAFGFVAGKGIGSGQRGSAKNIRLGLDLRGGVSVTYQANKELIKRELLAGGEVPGAHLEYGRSVVIK